MTNVADIILPRCMVRLSAAEKTEDGLIIVPGKLAAIENRETSRNGAMTGRWTFRRPMRLGDAAFDPPPAADLYVKAMVIEDGAGQRGVIVTSDLLGFPAAVAEPICERIAKQTGLMRHQILLNSSHTHAGPALSLKMSAKDSPGEASRTVE